MPGFATHFSFGLLFGIIAIVYIVSNAVLPQISAIVIAVAITIGAILPDMDSDTSIPFSVTSSLLSLITAISAYFYCKSHIYETLTTIFIMAIAASITRFMICDIIKSITKHRGIWHSLPAAAIAALATFLSLQYVQLNAKMRLYTSLALGAGYVLHLILDEGRSFFHFKFLMFWSPKQSLGSALKLFSKSSTVTILTYITLCILISMSLPLIIKLI